MGKQNEEWMLMQEVDATIAENERKLIQQQVEDSRKRLRLLNDLRQHPGFELYMQQMKQDQTSEFVKMNQGHDQHSLLTAASRYAALTCAIEWVREECDTLEQFLAGAVK